jgi:hypothetical protein
MKMSAHQEEISRPQDRLFKAWGPWGKAMDSLQIWKLQV